MLNFKTLTLALFVAMLCSPGLKAMKRKADDDLQDHTKKQRTEDKELCTIVCSNGEIKASYDLVNQCEAINNFIFMKSTPQFETPKEMMAIIFECLKSIKPFNSSNQDITHSLQTFFTQKNFDDNKRMNILETAQYLQCNVLSNAINAILHDQERSRLNLGSVSFLECTELTSQEIDDMFGIPNPSDQYQQTLCMAGIQEINPSPFNYSYHGIDNNQIDPRNIMSEFTGDQANYVPVQSPRNNDSNIDDINPNDIVLATIFINNVSNPSHDETNPFPVQSPQSVEDRPHKCTYEGCGKAFTQKGNLTKHIRIHTGEKPFICTHPGCGIAFTQECHLTRHIRIHTGEKPFTCTHPGCGKAFAQESGLTKHQIIHTGERRFQCTHEGCGKTFSLQDDLTSHIKIHTREKKFPCTYQCCNKAFTTKGDLINHIRIHTGERPFKCHYPGCNKAFAQKGNLTMHEKICKKKPAS